MRAERPILFSTGMVQALLAGRKTQTRRQNDLAPFSEAGGEFHWELEGTSIDPTLIMGSYANGDLKTKEAQGFHAHFHWSGFHDIHKSIRCRYGKPGDLLWVREKWSVVERHGLGEGRFVVFEDEWENGQVNERAPYRYAVFPYKYGGHPSIHMRKEWCRIWLEIADMRVERVQDISHEDALAEGVLNCPIVGAIGNYEYLWENINGRESWDANPYVWCISFKVLSTTGHPQPPQ